MSSSELFQEGKLSEAIDAAIASVKANPADMNVRYFLAELLCLAGQWERADKQLDTVFQQADDKAVHVILFRHLIRAEIARKQFFTEGRIPEFLFEVPDFLRLHLDASIAIREGNLSDAATVLEKAEAQRPRVAGKHISSDDDELSFAEFRDLDDLTSSFFEVITSTGKYYWVPIDKVKSIEFNAPRRTQDLIWRCVAMEVDDGPEGEVYLPTIYAGTSDQDDEQLKLGRGTDWLTPDPGPVRGLGQRMFLLGDEDRPIMQLSKLVFEHEG